MVKKKTIATLVFAASIIIVALASTMQQRTGAEGQNVVGLYYWTTARCSTGATGCNNLLSATLDAEDGSKSFLLFHYGPGQTSNQLQIDTMLSAISSSDNSKFRCYQVGMQGVSLSQLRTLAPIVKEEFHDNLGCSGKPWIGYNLESGLSPSSEVSNPSASYSSAKSIANANGLNLLATPARSISNNDASLKSISGKASLYNLQVAAIQGTSETDCSRLANEVDNRVDFIKAQYPNKLVTFQTSLTRSGASVPLVENCMDETYAASNVGGAMVWWGSANIDDGSWEETMSYWEQNFPSG